MIVFHVKSDIFTVRNDTKERRILTKHAEKDEGGIYRKNYGLNEGVPNKHRLSQILMSELLYEGQSITQH